MQPRISRALFGLSFVFCFALPRAGYGCGDTLGMPTVLVVDDQAMVLDVTLAQLKLWKITTEGARSGAEALAKYQPGMVVLVDAHMPHMSGLDVAAALQARDPLAKVVLFSGHMAPVEEGASALSVVRATIDKPYESEELVALLRRVAHAPATAL